MSNSTSIYDGYMPLLLGNGLGNQPGQQCYGQGMPPGTSMNDTTTQLIISFSGLASGGTSAVASFCRYSMAAETGAAACSDGLDNDCNGL